MQTFLGTIIATIIGGLITFFVAKYYYQRASNQLKIEADKLKKFNTMILRALEMNDMVELNKDPKTGEIVGFIISGKLSIKATSKASASGETIRKGHQLKE